MFVEAKYQAELSWKTSNSGGQKKYPGDQLIRNIRVGLHHCGYFAGKGLFETVPRDFVAILLAPWTENSLVRRYRREHKLRRAIPHSERLAALPRGPFVGEIGYGQIRDVLRSRRRFMTRAERLGVETFHQFLELKYGQMSVSHRSPINQESAGGYVWTGGSAERCDS